MRHTNYALRIAFLLSCLLALLALAACESATPTTTPAPAPEGSELQMLSRNAYVDPELFDSFERETGTKIIETAYFGDEDLLSELRTSPGKYDLAIASERAVMTLRGEDRLARLIFSNIANFQNVEARLKNLPFDPNNQFSAPYAWGTFGILYRTDKLKTIESWDIIFDEQRSKTSPASVALLDDPRAGVGAALKFLGLSLNTQSAADIARARELLVKRRTAINRFDSAAWSDALLTGEVTVAQARSNDAAFTQSTNANLRYAIPKEGAPLWMDNFAIPKESSRKAQAEAFINFLLRADSAAKNAVFTYSLSPVAAAYAKMDASRAALFRSGYIPDDATFKRSEFSMDVGSALKEYERIWNELKK